MNQDKQKILITIPTGTGKAILLAEYASKQESRTLIIVPNTELRIQAIEKLEMVDPFIDVGSVQASLNDVSNKVIIATRQSLTHTKSTRIEQMLKHGKFQTVIIDEVHQAVDQVKKIIHRINDKNIKIIGLTATPFNSKIFTVFDHIDYQKSILDMILQDYLCEPRALMIQSKTNLTEVKTTAGEFNQKELEEAVDTVERNRLVVQAYKEYAQKDRVSTLIFCVGIEHLNHMVEEFTEEGIFCKGLDSTFNDEDRKNVIEEFKSGKLPVLVNCGILTTGFDYPRLDCIILARPTKSKILYTQILGRGLRIHPDKTDLLVMDINDVVRKHDLMSISNALDIPMQSGDKFKTALVRYEKKKKEEEQLRQEAEKRAIERERLRQGQIKIVAEQIKLFNRDMKLAFENVRYDWYKVDNLVYSLTYAADVHYTIEDVNGKFVVYNTVTSKEDKRVEVIITFNNVKDAIAYVENNVKLNAFTGKKASWKSDPSTDGQRKYCSWARTKGEAHKFFSANTISGLLKRYKKAY